MKRARTLRRRVATSMSLLAIGVLAVAGAAVYFGARQVLVREIDEALVAMARAEIASSMDAPGGAIHVHEQPVPVSLGAGSGYEKFAEIFDDQGRVRAHTSNLQGDAPLEVDAERRARALDGKASFGDSTRAGERYRTVYHPLRSFAGDRLVVVVSVPLKPLDRTLDLLFASLVAAVVAGGGAAAGIAARLAGRLVRPMEDIAEAARSVVGAEPGVRVPVSGDAEVRELATILNEMLGRIEALLDAQRRFVADASHELRTPLSNLRGTIEVALRHSRSPEEYRSILERSLAEVERLSRLVAQLLTLSRADAGRLAMHALPCDLAAIAREAAEACGPRARERGVAVHVAAPAALAAFGDADRLREVADNLVDNALRWAPPASTVLVTVEGCEDGVALSVADAGPGIPPAEQERIFERFHRAERSRSRNHGGTGLGLAIAKAIVEAHAGRLTVESREGSGSTFRMWLPAGRALAGGGGDDDLRRAS